MKQSGTTFHFIISENMKQQQVQMLLNDINKLIDIQEDRIDFIDPKVVKGSTFAKIGKGSGFDRAFSSSGGYEVVKKSMDDSFFMSNFTANSSFNRGIWKKLEILVRRWAEDNKKVYITTGPIFSDSDESIGENNVTIPRAYFKVILDYTLPKYKSIGLYCLIKNQKNIYQIMFTQ